MGDGQAFIRLKLNTDEPIELGAFVRAFTALGDEYERFARLKHPATDPAATLYVKEVNAGSVEAILIPFVMGTIPAVMQNANELAEFVKNYGSFLSVYLKPGGRVERTTENQLRNFGDQVVAIANDPNSSLEAAAIEIVNGKEKAKAVFRFSSRDARAIGENVSEHRREIENTSDATYKKVLMTFTRTDVGDATVGRRSGERVLIEPISKGSLAVIYESDLAEQRIRHEIRDEEDNVYKKGFLVDVNVELRRGKPVAYRITRLHRVMDLPTDDEP